MELGTTLAIVAFADQCIKYGQKLMRRCQNYRHAEEEARELMVSIEHNWMKTEAQIKFLKNISHTLDHSYCNVQSRVLSELEGKLKTATLTMDQILMYEKEKKNGMGSGFDIPAVTKALEKMTLRKKVRYAFTKESLEKIRDDLEAWQRRFDPSWMLTMRIADSLVDLELDQEETRSKQTKFIMAAKGVRDAARESTSTTNPQNGSIFQPISILAQDRTTVPFSSIGKCTLRDSKQQVLVDTMICNPIADVDRTVRDVRKLARILSQVDPSTFGLLRCIAVVRDSTVTHSSQAVTSIDQQTHDFIQEPPPSFKFIFSIPSALVAPKSLRALLLERDPSFPLNSRFNLAKQMTNSVLFIHSSQFVHKNIRPEITIIFEKEEEPGRRELFLVGFEKFRPTEGMTYRTSDGIWQHDLYRHPSRQGTQPEEEYQMQHDIYSLGVLLLELGLWQSFITYPNPPTPSPSHSSSPLPADELLDTEKAFVREADLDLTTPIPPHFVAQHASQKDTRKRATAIKTHLISMASEMLPAKMGRKYTDIVLLCLRCLDTRPHVSEVGTDEDIIRSFDIGVEFEDVFDEDGIVIGVKYIEKILLKMQEISI